MKKYQLSKSSELIIEELKKLKQRSIIKEIQNLSPVEARNEFSKIRNIFAYKYKKKVLEVKNFEVDNISVRYYRGISNSKDDILPVMIYFHGGGWVLGDLDTHDQICRKLVSNAKYDIISVDYSLAPESPFPQAVKEGKKILKKISKSKLGLNIDNSKIIVCGDSAGGNIAAVLWNYNNNVLKANILFQVLIYPVTHFLGDFGSKTKYDGLILNKKLMIWFENHYLPKELRKKNNNDVRLSPIKEKKFNGLPDTLIILAECDPLYDEGILYDEF